MNTKISKTKKIGIDDVVALYKANGWSAADTANRWALYGQSKL